jgi:Zn-dependent protease
MRHARTGFICIGDKTAAQQKRISLNPLRHIDPIGLIMLIVFVSAGQSPFRWICEF